MNLGVGAAVVDGSVVAGDVAIEDGRVAAVALPGGSGRGLALPGFFDLHTHGFAGVDFSTAEVDEIDRVSEALTATGVTRFQPTLPTLTPEAMGEAVARHSAATYPGAKFGGSHLEGPFLSSRYPGAHPKQLLLEPDLEVARYLVESGRVAQMTIAPELPGALDLISYLISLGVKVSLGHSDADSALARAAFASGATGLTHAFNASRPLRHRDPGITGAALVDPNVFVTAIVDHVHLSGEVATIVARAAGDRLVAITDAMAAAGLGDGDFTLGDQEVNVVGPVARLSDGTIASSVLTMDAAFRNLVDIGLSVAEAAVATSLAPARMAGVDANSLRPGSPADMVVLDADLAVSATYIDGIRVFSR
jgi:N-acetylglucosamine-6-phosphate deacetylase